MNELSRAVALKALAADVAARLELGEKPNAIRAQLLTDGIPPEVIDHVFAECEATRSVGRRRTVIAAVLSGVLMIALPLAGAIGGAWAAYAIAVPAHAPEPDPEALEREAKNEQAGPALETFGTALVGMLIGGAIGLALAFAATKSLSAWSIDGSILDDEAYE